VLELIIGIYVNVTNLIPSETIAKRKFVASDFNCHMTKAL